MTDSLGNAAGAINKWECRRDGEMGWVDGAVTMMRYVGW